jgi:hypothetical protein
VERTQTVTGSAAAGEFHRQQIAEHRQRRAADERFPFNAGQLTAKALSRLGVRHLFTLSGGHLFPLYDGCVERGIHIVDHRHEEAACHAAEAYAKFTRQPGVCAVTAGLGVARAGEHRRRRRGGLPPQHQPRLKRELTELTELNAPTPARGLSSPPPRRGAPPFAYDPRMPAQGDSLTRRLWLDHGRCGTDLCRVR